MKRGIMSSAVGILLTLGLFLVGCASDGSAPQGSALLDLSSPDKEPISVSVETIDDGSARAWGVFRDSKLVPLTPGSHEVALTISDYWERDPKLMGGKTSLKAKDTVTFSVLAQHTYRFAASRSEYTFDLVLWDETGGKKTDVRHWSLDALTDFQPFTS